MKLPQGKYLILKDPNKTTLLLYEIPQNTFEGDDDDEDEEDIEEGPEETGDADGEYFILFLSFFLLTVTHFSHL